MTFTLKVQEVCAGQSCARETDAARACNRGNRPATARAGKAVRRGNTRPAGRVSVNATPVSEIVVFGLLMVKLSEVLPFSWNGSSAERFGNRRRRGHTQVRRSRISGSAIGGSHVAGGVGVVTGSSAGHRHAELALAVGRDGRAGQERCLSEPWSSAFRRKPWPKHSQPSSRSAACQ